MKTIVLYIITILAFNILILLLPILFFLLSLTLSNPKIFDLFIWLYIPFALCSPVLTLILGCKIALKKTGIIRWILPLVVSSVGFSPIWFTYLSISSVLSMRDFILILCSPVLLGLTSIFLTYALKTKACRKFLGST